MKIVKTVVENKDTKMVRVTVDDIPYLKELKYDFRVDSMTMVIHELIKEHKANKESGK